MILRDGEKTTIMPEGRIDTTRSPEFEAEMTEALNGTVDLVMDCSRMDYISSSGLKVILQAVREMLTQGTFRIVNANDVVYEILEVTGFTGVCTVEKQPE